MDNNFRNFRVVKTGGGVRFIPFERWDMRDIEANIQLPHWIEWVAADKIL